MQHNMEFHVKSGTPEKQRTACLVVGVFLSRKLTEPARPIDKAAGGLLSNILRKGDLEGKAGQTLLLHTAPNLLCERILLVGCGKERKFDDTQFARVVDAATRALGKTGVTEFVSYLTELEVKGRDIGWKIAKAAEVTENAVYEFNQLKSKKDKDKKIIRKVTLSVPSRSDLTIGEHAVRIGQSIAKGMTLARNLGNLPGNICTPTYLANTAKKFDQEYGTKTKVLDESAMQKLGMGALLSVSRGSRQPARLIVCEYHGGNQDDAPVALVGKGLTFDAGGISIKPATAMDEMKYDMCGGASVLGAIKAIAEMKLPINVVGIIPSSENLPDGDANKPGDIVTSMAGITIEILNTDAEGRLILCDALSYAESFKPVVVVDIATLTGACVVALGDQASGLLGNSDGLCKELFNAGKISNDRAWQLPLWDGYQKQLDSNFADIANIGGRGAGTITAACFLSRFTKKMKWAHLDIAGTAWKTGKEKGATGRPVALLTHFLIHRCNGYKPAENT